MATKYRMTGHYDQPRVDPDEWIANGRPVGAFPTRTHRPGDTIEPRNDEERDRLLRLGVIEEAPEQQSDEDVQRQIDERREEAAREQQEASEGAGKAVQNPPASNEVARLAEENDAETLRSMAADRELPQSGSKRELAERISAHDARQE